MKGRTSIRFRLMVLMICLTTLPVITVTWIATNNTRNSVESEIINANNSRMLWADQYLNELIQQLDTMFYTLQINEQLMDGMDDMDSPDAGVQFQTQKYMRDTLNSVFYANSRKVDNLTLYVHPTKKSFAVSFASNGLISPLDIHAGPWKRILSGPISLYFKQFDQGVYAFHSINRFEDHKLLGGLSARINKDVWDEVSGILKSEPESSVFLINDEGEMLSGSNLAESSNEIQAQIRNLQLHDSGVTFKATKNYFFFMKRIDAGQLTVVKAIPLETITHSARATMTAGIWTGSLFAAASILLSILVSLRISRPIVTLAKTMKNTHIHNFEMKSVQSRDEIGLLEHGYNSMMQRIKELIEVEYRQEIDVKSAQLLALQAQINPHFLNNTLHLIGGMALAKNAPEIYRITQVIGDLLRYSISSAGGMVPLADELKHMKNYLYIQEQRFASRCKLVVVVDETLLDSRLPKFTLQPIVENAFEHGLQRKVGAWNLEVRIKRTGRRILMMVKDEGVGIPEERLRQLRRELRDDLPVKETGPDADGPKRRRGIGLRNVNARLKLQFGEHFGLRIFSKPESGTAVFISLPILEKEDAKDA